MSVPRIAAARIAGLGGGSASSSVPMADGASGRGGRASGGAARFAHSGITTGGKLGSCPLQSVLAFR